MLVALSYLIEFAVQAVFMIAALWVMIKIQNLDYTFLGLLICGALSSAIDIIPYCGHYLAVPTLYVCVARMTRADVFPDAVFTVVVAYALTFCMNLFLLGALMGDLRPSANEEANEVIAQKMEEMEREELAPNQSANMSNQVAVTKSDVAPIVPRKAATPAKSDLSEDTIKSFSLKGLNLGAARPSAVLGDGKRTFTLEIGESRTVTTPDGPVTVKCERVTANTAAITLNGEPVTLKMW